MRPTPPSSYDKASACASYLLIPWSNRVEHGLFRFRGKDYQLRLNSSDGTAIHGVAKEYAWQVERVDPTKLVAVFDSRAHQDVNFPFAFSARAEFVLDGARFVHRLSLKNEGPSAMPAGFGHHPYFQRWMLSPVDEVKLQIPCTEYFPADRNIPTGPPIPVDDRLDFRKARSVGNVFIDDCLTSRVGGQPVIFSYPQSHIAIELDIGEPFEQVVLYAPVGATYFAVEPVTNANDGFNLFERRMRNSGVFVLEPGEERTGAFVLELLPRP
jgi:aldose 1-epimerase